MNTLADFISLPMHPLSPLSHPGLLEVMLGHSNMFESHIQVGAVGTTRPWRMGWAIASRQQAFGARR